VEVFENGNIIPASDIYPVTGGVTGRRNSCSKQAMLIFKMDIITASIIFPCNMGCNLSA